MFKVRYHLQNGPHKNHWQFKDLKSKETFYHNPSDKVIKIYNCVLHNNRSKANKIFLGSNKDVCAWIKFKNMEFVDSPVPSWSIRLHYNPKVFPYWHFFENSSCKNIDSLAFDELYLCDKGVFFDNCRKDCFSPF